MLRLFDASDNVEAYAYANHLKAYGGGGCESDTEYCHLPEDVVFEEILPRLPAESLRRFRGVSKKWYQYITNDSRFISNHHSTKLSIIVTQQHPHHRMLFVDHHKNKVEVIDVATVEKRCAGEFSRCHVVGSCNGLVCLGLRFGDMCPEPLVVAQDKREAVMLWNPETGEGRDTRVPPLPSSFYLEMRMWKKYPVYGFGFDQSHNDYKVVRVTSTPSGFEFHVFSRNTGSWRGLEKGLSGYTLCDESDNSVLIQSCLYWVVLAVDERPCVLWFDVSTDEFGIVDHIHHSLANQQNIHHRLFFVKDESLTYLSLHVHASKDVLFQFFQHVDITTLPRDNHPPKPWKFCGVSSNQYFVEENKSNLLMYDCKTGVAQQLLSTLKCNYVTQAREYVPSLISVYPDLTTMAQETKKMEARYWVGVFWKYLGITKHYRTREPCLASKNILPPPME